MPVGKGLKFAANFWIHLYDFQVYLLWLHLTMAILPLSFLWRCSLWRSLLCQYIAAILTNPYDFSDEFQTFHLVGCDNRNYLQSGTMARRGSPANHRSKGY